MVWFFLGCSNSSRGSWFYFGLGFGVLSKGFCLRFCFLGICLLVIFGKKVFLEYLKNKM